MTTTPQEPAGDNYQDPDADPGNMNPRDTLDQPDGTDEDPDADPGNMNPRDTLDEPTA